ncbi:MAG TPA: alpha/beta hydrolase [Acidimicrobiales bacterium]|nr:alpha/beta hydrolase [Acidimicrobiales bacterium]
MDRGPLVRTLPSTDGVTVALHDLGGEGPPLLLCHPTGFLAMTWAPMAAALAGVAHCWALDFRGHGESTTPAPSRLCWSGMADDVLAAVGALGTIPVRAAGHSMGGAAVLLAEERQPGTFSGLWLFEPIVLPPPEGARGPNPLSEGARRRRRRFPDREAAYANFASKPPLQVLAPAALRAYVDHGLREAPDGDGVVLACAPETEAVVFENGMVHPTFTRLGEVRCPVVVAAGGDLAGPAAFAPVIADRLPHGRLERYPHLTHFGPMEDPPAMAAAVRAALDLA